MEISTEKGKNFRCVIFLTVEVKKKSILDN